MIKLIDNLEIYDCTSFEDDVFFQRILSDFHSSSMLNDSLFYISLNNNTPDAVIGKVGSVITLSSKDNAPLEEIAEFFSVIGYSVILCEEKFSHFFCGEKIHGDVLKIIRDRKTDCKAEVLYSENLKDVYNLLMKTFNIQADFMNWFADMSHKLRHGVAKCCGIYEKGELVSCAFSVFETEKSAVISSVATDKEYRCNGYGKKVVETLLSENMGKHIYVFTEKKDINNWYKNIGFTEYKKWSEIKNVL